MGISVRPHLRRAQRRSASTRLTATTRRGHSAAVGGESIGPLDRPELRIRDLRDDPRLRLAMGLDNAESTPPRPEPRFDRRRLLDRAAA